MVNTSNAKHSRISGDSRKICPTCLEDSLFAHHIKEKYKYLLPPKLPNGINEEELEKEK